MNLHSRLALRTFPLVSTIIPTYNRRDLVVCAIDSALKQTYSNQEIVVVDDGSTDGTEDYLRERYSERISYISQPNMGVSGARNHGMRAASGELFAFLDSDDEWESTKLEKQVEFMSLNPDYGMVVTDVSRIDTSRTEIDVFKRRDVFPEDGHVLECVLMNPSLVPASAMIRKEVFVALGGFEESLVTAEDIEFHLRVAANFKIGLVEESLTVAMRGGVGLSGCSSSDSDYIRVVEQFIDSNRERLSSKTRVAALFTTYLRNSASSYRSGRIVDGSRYLMRAFPMIRTLAHFRRLLKTAYVGAKAVAVHGIRTVLGQNRGAGPLP